MESNFIQRKEYKKPSALLSLFLIIVFLIVLPLFLVSLFVTITILTINLNPDIYILGMQFEPNLQRDFIMFVLLFFIDLFFFKIMQMISKTMKGKFEYIVKCTNCSNMYSVFEDNPSVFVCPICSFKITLKEYRDTLSQNRISRIENKTPINESISSVKEDKMSVEEDIATKIENNKVTTEKMTPKRVNKTPLNDNRIYVRDNKVVTKEIQKDLDYEILQLEKLKRLKEKGYISEEEYEEKRQIILNKIVQ